jgi:hypothetical protein
MIKLSDILKENECWDRYKPGKPKTKISPKTGKRVNNCVPINEEEETPQLNFPEGFQPAKSVPQGGSMCANCAKWNKEEQLCEGQYYVEWNGSGEIPAEPTEYICIWWVDKTKQL